MDKPEYWVTNWWLPLAVAIIGGLIVLAVAGFWSEKVANNVWKPLWRLVRWPFVNIRITTAARQKAAADELEAAARETNRISEQGADEIRKMSAKLEKVTRQFREVCDLLQVWPVRDDSTVVPERIRDLQEAAERARVHAHGQIEANRAIAQKQITDERRINEGKVELARTLGREEGYAEAMAEVAEQRAVPATRPVWHVRRAAAASTFELANVQEDATASDVAIAAPMADFVFHGPNQWRGAFAGPVEFTGQRAGTGRTMDIKFAVRYRDANGDWQPGEAVLARPPRRAVVL